MFFFLFTFFFIFSFFLFYFFFILPTLETIYFYLMFLELNYQSLLANISKFKSSTKWVYIIAKNKCSCLWDLLSWTVDRAHAESEAAYLNNRAVCCFTDGSRQIVLLGCGFVDYKDGSKWFNGSIWLIWRTGCLSGSASTPIWEKPCLPV